MRAFAARRGGVSHRGGAGASNARPVVKLAFESFVLTATRPGEVRGAAPFAPNARADCGRMP